MLVTLDTVFGDDITPAAIEGLAVGDVVEVSGIVPADGIIEATRIDIKPDGGPYDVSGYVTRVSVATHRFNVNALVVDYSAANMEDFTTGDPAIGDLVKVTGATFLADGALVALHVELRSDDYLTAGPGDVVEVEGVVELRVRDGLQGSPLGRDHYGEHDLRARHGGRPGRRRQGAGEGRRQCGPASWWRTRSRSRK